MRLWEEEGGDGVHVHDLGQGEYLVPPLQQPLHIGGLGGKVLQPGGLGLEDAGDKLESHEGAGNDSESLGDAGNKLEDLKGAGGVVGWPVR